MGAEIAMKVRVTLGGEGEKEWRFSSKRSTVSQSSQKWSF